MIITLNDDDTFTFNKDGLIFVGTRTGNTTLEIVYTGPIRNIPWIPDGSQIEWRQTLTFDSNGRAFTASSQIMVNLLTSKWVEVSEPAQLARCLQPICHRVTTID